MSRGLRNLGQPRRARRLVVALTISAMGVAACGGDDGDASGTTGAPSVESESSASGGADSEPILIETRMTLTPEEEIVSTGKILDGSTIGDSPFCPGGTIEDKHGSEDPAEEPFGLVDRTITCPDGTLRMGFTPGIPQGRTQAGPWRIVSGTGAYEGWQGSGEMKMVYDPGSGARPTNGNETFTGTVVQ